MSEEHEHIWDSAIKDSSEYCICGAERSKTDGRQVKRPPRNRQITKPGRDRS